MRVCHITITAFFWPGSVAAGIITPAPQWDSPWGSSHFDPVRYWRFHSITRYGFWLVVGRSIGPFCSFV